MVTVHLVAARGQDCEADHIRATLPHPVTVYDLETLERLCILVSAFAIIATQTVNL